MITAKLAEDYIRENHLYTEPVSQIKEKNIMEAIRACRDTTVKPEDVIAIHPLGNLMFKYRSGVMFTKTKVYTLGKYGGSVAYDDIIDVDDHYLILKNGKKESVYGDNLANMAYYFYKTEHPEEAKTAEEAKAVKAAQEEEARRNSTQSPGGTVDVSGMSEKELLKHMTFQQIIANAANELAAKGMVCPETFSVLEKLCDDDPGAAYLAAVILEDGLGVPRDRDRAEKYYRFSADSGNHYAQATLGRLLVFGGRGYEKNVQEGLNYLGMAIDQGDVDAMYVYGKLLESGWEGVTQDPVMASYFLEKGKTSSLANQ